MVEAAALKAKEVSSGLVPPAWARTVSVPVMATTFALVAGSRMAQMRSADWGFKPSFRAARVWRASFSMESVWRARMLSGSFRRVARMMPANRSTTATATMRPQLRERLRSCQPSRKAHTTMMVNASISMMKKGDDRGDFLVSIRFSGLLGAAPARRLEGESYSARFMRISPVVPGSRVW